MSVTRQLRHRLVDAPSSPAQQARRRRWELVRTLFPDLDQMHVVDLGGTVRAWQVAPVRPRTVTILNLTEPGESDDPTLVPVTGDACDAVAVLERRGTPPADLVFSNAVIEHVGGHANRVRFADAVRRLAPRHWVQTPYRYFPLEPHWLFPGMQFLPLSAKTRVARHWPLAHTPATSLDGARSAAQWTELVGVTEMRGYFPDSRLHHEKALGLTKSLVAVRGESGQP